MKTDIFEDMKDWVGCKYISDLPYRKREVWETIKQQSPLAYPYFFSFSQDRCKNA